MEPFLAVGEMLAEKGHEVVFAFPAQFAELVPDNYPFHALSPKFIELVESEEGKLIMGKASLWTKFRALLYLYKEGMKVNQEMAQQQYQIVAQETPDLIIHHAKCNYPPLWGMQQEGHRTVLLSPVLYLIHPVEGHPHVGFNRNLGAFLNRLTYRIANFGLVKTIYDVQKHLPTTTTFSRATIKKAVKAQKLVFTVSESLFKRPAEWPKNVQVLGYHERNKQLDWQPDTSLTEFLGRHQKVLFLTFGSMINADPEATSRMLFEVLDKLGIATIINTAAGGLLRLEEFAQKDTFYFTARIPYDWILDKVYAIAHHGGSGTTHAGLKYACPTLIIPHIIDQFGWNHLIAEIGAGPKGIGINKLKAHQFEQLILDLMNNPKYKQAVDQITTQMSNERLEDQLYQFLTDVEPVNHTT